MTGSTTASLLVAALSIAAVVTWLVVRGRAARRRAGRPAALPATPDVDRAGGQHAGVAAFEAGARATERRQNLSVGRVVVSVRRAPVFALIEGLASLPDAEEVTAELAKAVEAAPPTFDGVCAALRRANLELHRKSVGLGRTDHGGASVVVLALEGSVARIAHVGALRIYVVSEGLVKLLTYDHGVVRDAAAARGLSEDVLGKLLEHPRTPHRDVVTRLVGNKPEVTLDLLQWACHPGDTFLLLSRSLALAANRETLRQACMRADELEALADAAMSSFGTPPALFADPTALFVQVA